MFVQRVNDGSVHAELHGLLPRFGDQELVLLLRFPQDAAGVLPLILWNESAILNENLLDLLISMSELLHELLVIVHLAEAHDVVHEGQLL